METEHETLNKRQVFGEESVEESDEEDDGDSDKGAVPSFVYVVGIVEDDETLDLGSSQEATNASTSLPAQDTKPADNIGQLLLDASRCKFRDPMVLSASSGGHRSHFSHRNVD